MAVITKLSAYEALLDNGWALIPASYIGDLYSLLRSLGELVSTGNGRAEFRDLVPYARSAAPARSMSSFTGTDEQPMHTDRASEPTPPRYLALQCLERGEVSCPTYVWVLDSARILAERPQILTSPVWVFHDGVNAPFYSAIVGSSGNCLKARFDPFCMRAASFSANTLTEAANSLKHYTRRSIVEWETGSLLLINNWVCLHARGPGGAEAPSRRLRRWYIGGKHGLAE